MCSCLTEISRMHEFWLIGEQWETPLSKCKISMSVTEGKLCPRWHDSSQRRDAIKQKLTNFQFVINEHGDIRKKLWVWLKSCFLLLWNFGQITLFCKTRRLDYIFVPQRGVFVLLVVCRDEHLTLIGMHLFYGILGKMWLTINPMI